jgi:hypothetical protein
MLERFWLSAEKSRWRLSGLLFVIGAVNAVGFFWHYHRSPVFAFFDPYSPSFFWEFPSGPCSLGQTRKKTLFPLWLALGRSLGQSLTEQMPVARR